MILKSCYYKGCSSCTCFVCCITACTWTLIKAINNKIFQILYMWKLMLVTDTKKCIKSPCVILRHDCRFYTRTKDLICKMHTGSLPQILQQFTALVLTRLHFNLQYSLSLSFTHLGLISRVGCSSRYLSSWLLPASVVLRKWRAEAISATVITQGWEDSLLVTCHIENNKAITPYQLIKLLWLFLLTF